jgi:hypothetical protein
MKDTITIPKDVLLDLVNVAMVLTRLLNQSLLAVPPTDEQINTLKYANKIIIQINQSLKETL